MVIFAASTRIAETIIHSPKINPQGLNAQLIRIISKISSTAGAMALILYDGQYLGIPVGTLVASAGIGGLAIPLGAQDTLKDLFGRISLMADKPFRVGERIAIDKFQDHEGMHPDYPPRVFFDEFAAQAFRIRFLYWYTPPNYWDFKAFGDQLNIEIFRAFVHEGIQFSMPLRHTYWKHDQEQGPLDVQVSGIS